MPQVSIILPTYNRADLITRSIDSVVKQSFENWELIVWDDGSTDQTKEIVNSYHDKRIHYYYESNHGLAYARNQAIEKASGKYLAFLDSDDEWMTNKLEKQVAVMQRHVQIELLFTNFLNINILQDKQEIAFDSNADAIGLLQVEEIEDHLFVINNGWLESLAISDYVATPSILMKREVLQRVGHYNETLRNSVDFELKWRMGLNHVCCAFTDEVLMIRHKPPGSLSSPGKDTVINNIKALDLCKQYSISFGRAELVDHLHRPYRNAWHNMITACAAEGDRAGMLHAFRQSLNYGFRPGALHLLWTGWRTLITQSNPSDNTN